MCLTFKEYKIITSYKTQFRIKESNKLLKTHRYSIGFGWFYDLVSVLSPSFASVYHFSSSKIGLRFLAGGVGSILCTAFYCALSDRVSNHRTKRNNGVRLPEYRLTSNYIGLPFLHLGQLLYG
ncbi:hypothetical protein J3Q64DRAFT_1819680 [Phycomyces blakesleeanus]|uniref:Uncharacterized protein n=2 Tax=Phycomyces blakesleeanus TaxID=4837 RepID=A0A162Q8Q8_PHYB8|nr:hypothetical protein PHYBLDRAFT_62095 [Phycomyces blakesleeanus NRRL 1555(-)]OAD81046.1 hypothetical protein PHYBLDRAFT_62095 [Phycomyces blakesleeanus NRRL 1555(-)]|eukprot:XP_018299086.1 hypothetical protein PHYBLDRAFT_62095 [Phycomyces blakesleeanus NRRL 1555(-)]